MRVSRIHQINIHFDEYKKNVPLYYHLTLSSGFDNGFDEYFFCMLFSR